MYFTGTFSSDWIATAIPPLAVPSSLVSMIPVSSAASPNCLACSPLVKENYFMVTLGVNFNELWFWRNKLK